MPSFEPVTAVVRGLQVLQVLNQLGEATISELHKTTQLHKSTILRMLETLIHEGYITRLESDSRYVPTGKCLLLSSGFRSDKDLVRLAEPHLARFRRACGWPSDVAVFDHNAMMIATTNREFGTMSLNRQAGSRVPILMSSLGRAYLAFCEPEKINRVLDELAKSSDAFDAPAKNKSAILRVLGEIRKRGYATPDPIYADKAYQNQINGFSAPVFAGNEVIASVNVMFHSVSLSVDEAKRTLLPSLLSLAEGISESVSAERDCAPRRVERQANSRFR
jgi:IclR family transcriptional regulator, mhp operon transcriptional activator